MYIFILLESGGDDPESISRFAARAPLFTGNGKHQPMRRSELYQKVCSNRAPQMEEARAGGKSARAGTHSLAAFTI